MHVENRKKDLNINHILELISMFSKIAGENINGQTHLDICARSEEKMSENEILFNRINRLGINLTRIGKTL